MPYLLPYSNSVRLPHDGNKGSVLCSGGGSVHVALSPTTGLSL